MNKYKIVTDISKIDRSFLVSEIHRIINNGWGDWGVDYIRDHIVSADFIALAKYAGVIVGFATARKMVFAGNEIYYLEFTAIDPTHQGNKLSLKLNKEIFKQIIWQTMKKFRIGFEIVTISPNPRILGSLIRTASSVFPSPYHPTDRATSYVWGLTNKVLKNIGDPYNSFDRKNNVLQGFYDETPHLIYKNNKVPKDRDDKVNKFAWDNLKYDEEKGREFVIYAKYSLADFLKRSDI